MRKKVCLFLACLFVFRIIYAGESPARRACLKQIKENYLRFLVSSDEERSAYLNLLAKIPVEREVSDQNIVELYQRFPVTTEEIELLVSTLGPNGAWPDIDYQDKKRSGWEPKKHTERILKLARYYYESRVFYPERLTDSLLRTIHCSLAFWFHRDFSCLNWWYNQIGVPKTLGTAFLLLEDELSADEKMYAIREMKYSRFGMTGQNKVWLAGNVLIRGLLEEDYALVEAARDTIVSEIVLGKPEGIKSDWSFHQHGPQQQMGNYGLSFLSNMCMYVELFAKTPLAFSSGQQNDLFSFFKEGYQWFIWRGFMDVNGLNRQLFRYADIHKAYTLLFSVFSLMQGCTSEQAEEIREFVRYNFLEPMGNNLWVGNKVFSDSDETIHRTSQWMASVKMASRRVIGTELVNEDNKLGYYLGDGALYIYTDGNPYRNIFPFWDWRKIPGITCIESVAPIPVRYGPRSRNQSDFVGGISDGTLGVTAMELNRDGIYAHKAWVFTENGVLCLGSELFANEGELTTSVEQALKSGDLLVEKKRKWQAIKREFSIAGQSVRFFHRNTGYIVLQGDTCIAKVENRCGKWSDVMGMYKPQLQQQEVTALYIKHRGGIPSAYQYLILPARTKEEVLKYDLRQVKVVRNDRDMQVVLVGGKCYVVAYRPGGFILPDKNKVDIQTAGLYIIDFGMEKGKIYAADPTRTVERLYCTINGYFRELFLNKHTFTFSE